MKTLERTIVAAADPMRYEDSYTEIWLRVWFEEMTEPVDDFLASLFDEERHGKELWVRAMGGEYGVITVVPNPPVIPGLILMSPPPRWYLLDPTLSLPIHSSPDQLEPTPRMLMLAPSRDTE